MSEFRVEYWQPVRNKWGSGHAGVRLRNPEKYVAALKKNGFIARVTDLHTDEVFIPEGGDLL